MKYIALIDDNQVVQGLLMATDYGMFQRDEGDWVPLDPDDDFADDMSEWDSLDTTEKSVPMWDFAQLSSGRMVRSDL